MSYRSRTEGDFPLFLFLCEQQLITFGIKGQDVIYVGDRIDKDIVPANLNNINTVYIHRGGKYDIPHADLINTGSHRPDYDVTSLNELFDIIDDINNKNIKG